MLEPRETLTQLPGTSRQTSLPHGKWSTQAPLGAAASWMRAETGDAEKQSPSSQPYHIRAVQP